MGFRCGLVGLPNAGKSTLFNALTGRQTAEAANFPFCTIDPNRAEVAVPDPRLKAIAQLANSAVQLPTRMTFVDIAGLVRGASKGEGLGNQFLAHIREMDAVALVLRCFSAEEIIHVHGRVDPVDDALTIETELMLADLEVLERRIPGYEKRIRAADRTAARELAVVQRAIARLADGVAIRDAQWTEEEFSILRSFQLLSAKPLVCIANVDEDGVNEADSDLAQIRSHFGARKVAVPTIAISAQVEAELTQIEDLAERQAFLLSLGLERTALDRVIRAGYDLLDLITFFTAGKKETRAWAIPKGTLAPQAAGTIHTDFENGFIRAETIAYQDFVDAGGEAKAREAGKMRLEGKDYPVADGDIMHFRFAN